MAVHCRFLYIGVLAPLCVVAVAAGQAPPKSFKELRGQIDNAKSVPALVKSIGLVYRFRSSGSREFLCKALGMYRDPEVRCAIYKQMAHHPHAQILKQLQKGFSTGTPAKELDAIVTALNGQGREGQLVLTAGTSSKDAAIRKKSIGGLRGARDQNEATLSLLQIFNKSDLSTKARILNDLVVMRSDGLAFARVEKLAFHILAKEKNSSLRLAALKQLHGGRANSTVRALVALKKEFELSKSSSLIRGSARGLLSHDRPGLSILLKGLQSDSSLRRDIAVSVLGAKGKNRRVTLALIEQFEAAKPPLQATLFGILSSHEVIPQLTALRLSVLD
ncbi:MAG: hypothetical protein VX951_13645, partial [Planctomycetota bacterium]|nr:hypothetical protein [Planctomycetota bacterium]